MGVPLGNRSFSNLAPGIDDVSNYTVGLMIAYELDTLNSIDFNFQVTDFFRDAFTPGNNITDPQRLTGTTYNFNIEYGTYQVVDKIQLMTGLGYFTTTIDDFWEAALFAIGGVAFELYNDYVLVFGATYTLLGKNQPRTLGLGFSFTTVWD